MLSDAVGHGAEHDGLEGGESARSEHDERGVVLVCDVENGVPGALVGDFGDLGLGLRPASFASLQPFSASLDASSCNASSS